jgi:F-type H+-transporting ATPase subunit b
MTGGGESWLSWVFKFVNFAVLLGVLIKFAGKPLKDYFRNKHTRIKDKVEEAERKSREAEALRSEYEKKLAQLEIEVETFRKGIVEETEREKKKILAEAEQLAARIREQAKLTYEQEARSAAAKVREEIAKLTMERAEVLLREKVTKEDHGKMVDEFIEKVRSLN